jgi:hypothetical protein
VGGLDHIASRPIAGFIGKGQRRFQVFDHLRFRRISVQSQVTTNGRGSNLSWSHSFISPPQLAALINAIHFQSFFFNCASFAAMNARMSSDLSSSFTVQSKA